MACPAFRALGEYCQYPSRLTIKLQCCVLLLRAGLRTFIIALNLVSVGEDYLSGVTWSALSDI